MVTTALESHEAHRLDDFFGCLHALLSPDVGMDKRFVWDNFGVREPWDRAHAGLRLGEGKELTWTEPQDPIIALIDPKRMIDRS